MYARVLIFRPVRILIEKLAENEIAAKGREGDLLSQQKGRLSSKQNSCAVHYEKTGEKVYF